MMKDRHLHLNNIVVLSRCVSVKDQESDVEVTFRIYFCFRELATLYLDVADYLGAFSFASKWCP